MLASTGHLNQRFPRLGGAITDGALHPVLTSFVNPRTLALMTTKLFSLSLSSNSPVATFQRPRDANAFGLLDRKQRTKLQAGYVVVVEYEAFSTFPTG